MTNPWKSVHRNSTHFPWNSYGLKTGKTLGIQDMGMSLEIDSGGVSGDKMGLLPQPELCRWQLFGLRIPKALTDVVVLPCKTNV